MEVKMETDKKEYRKIKACKGAYEIASDGTLRNIKTKRNVKPRIRPKNPDDYYRYLLDANRNKRRISSS